MKQKKLILVKLIGIGNDDKDENDSIEKEGYKYNEDKCNNKDNDDDDSNNKVYKYNNNDGIEYESEDDGIEYYMY